jgi:hypothetical protein
MLRVILCLIFLTNLDVHGFSFSGHYQWSPIRAVTLRSCVRSSTKPKIISIRCSAGASWEHDMREKALVSTSWLAERLGTPDLAVLDVRGEVGKEDKGNGLVVTSYQALKQAYLQSHIPGAVFGKYSCSRNADVNAHILLLMHVRLEFTDGARHVVVVLLFHRFTVDWTKDIVDSTSPVPVQLAPSEVFEAAMEASLHVSLCT